MASGKVKKMRVGVFLDGSNILWGSRKSGINIDFEKLKRYLNKHFSPVVLNYYACEDNRPLNNEYIARANAQKKFYQKLETMGYELVRKDLKHLAGGKTKCDMDIEITMDIRNYESDIDCIILFSGDSDFVSVVRYYWELGKFIRIFSFAELLSWELKTFAMKNPRCNYKIINEIRSEIERN